MKSSLSRFFARMSILAISGSAVVLSGCSSNFGGSTSTPEQVSMQKISGVAHGGQQGLVGAQIYLYAVGTGGYGTASTLVAGPATTDAQGNFSFNGGFNCTAGQQLYLYSAGGDPQAGPGGASSGNNTGAGLLAVAGHCTGGTGITNSQGTAVGFVFMNEISTIAAAYSLSAYATDATHIGSSGTALAKTNLSNAVDTAFNLANQSTGLALTAPLNGNGTVPGTEINALADILAVCVNSVNSSSSGCTTLFSNATNGSTAPTETATAAINIAHNPTANVTTLLNMVNSSGPFQPIISSATSFTLAVNYTGGGLNAPVAIAVDASGNIWVANQATVGGTQATGRVSEFNHLGVPANSTGYTGGGLILGQSVAVDLSGNVWVGSTTLASSINNLSKFDGTTGAAISGTNGYTGGGIGNPIGLAIDPSGNAWAANDAPASGGVFDASEFNSSGTALSPAGGFPDGIANGQGVAIDPSGNPWFTGGNGTGTKVGKLNGSTGALISTYTGGGIDVPLGIAFDSTGNVWISNDGNNSLTELNSAGTAISPSTGFTGGGLKNPGYIAIDGAGKIWISDGGGSALSEFNSSGTAISPSAGFTGGSMNVPDGVAIDGAGNIWTPNAGGQSLTEFIGAATPVITPLVANLTTGTKKPAQVP